MENAEITKAGGEIEHFGRAVRLHAAAKEELEVSTRQRNLVLTLQGEESGENVSQLFQAWSSRFFPGWSRRSRIQTVRQHLFHPSTVRLKFGAPQG